jgi:beta-lactam-binding protein with PASTA domain
MLGRVVDRVPAGVDDEQTVPVPALVGLPIGDAHALATEAGVVVVSADPDDPLPQSGTVTAQQPLGGISVPAASTVQVLVERGGGGGGTPAVVPPPEPLDPAGTA